MSSRRVSVGEGTNSEVARRPAVAVFIAVWVLAQLAVPLVSKFPPPTFQYQHVAKFGWSPYTSPPLRYELALFVVAGDGTRRPIDGIERYVPRLRSPEPQQMWAPIDSAEQVQDRWRRLLDRIASDRRDGETYELELNWTFHFPSTLPDRFDYAVTSPAR